MLQAFVDRVRRVLLERRHYRQRPGATNPRQRLVLVEPGLERDLPEGVCGSARKGDARRVRVASSRSSCRRSRARGPAISSGSSALRAAVKIRSPFFSSTRPKNAIRRSGSGWGRVGDPCVFAGRVEPREVGNHERAFRELPALVPHPIDQVGAWTDDDVSELDGRLLENADAEHCIEILQRDVRREVRDVASRAVAEHHEQRVLECEAGLPQTQCRIHAARRSRARSRRPPGRPAGRARSCADARTARARPGRDRRGPGGSEPRRSRRRLPSMGRSSRASASRAGSRPNARCARARARGTSSRCPSRRRAGSRAARARSPSRDEGMRFSAEVSSVPAPLRSLTGRGGQPTAIS